MPRIFCCLRNSPVEGFLTNLHTLTGIPCHGFFCLRGPCARRDLLLFPPGLCSANFCCLRDSPFEGFLTNLPALTGIPCSDFLLFEEKPAFKQELTRTQPLSPGFCAPNFCCLRNSPVERFLTNLPALTGIPCSDFLLFEEKPAFKRELTQTQPLSPGFCATDFFCLRDSPFEEALTPPISSPLAVIYLSLETDLRVPSPCLKSSPSQLLNPLPPAEIFCLRGPPHAPFTRAR